MLYEFWKSPKNEEKEGEILYLPYGSPQSFTPSMQIIPQIVSDALDATRADTPPTRAAASSVRLVAIVRSNC